jgi:hypothetical protein
MGLAQFRKGFRFKELSVHGVFGPSRLERASHPFFEFHAEAVCNAVDEIKVGND